MQTFYHVKLLLYSTPYLLSLQGPTTVIGHHLLLPLSSITPNLTFIAPPSTTQMLVALPITFHSPLLCPFLQYSPVHGQYSGRSNSGTLRLDLDVRYWTTSWRIDWERKQHINTTHFTTKKKNKIGKARSVKVKQDPPPPPTHTPTYL